MNFDAIYAAGDTHCLIKLNKIIEESISNNCLYIQCGDDGSGFYPFSDRHELKQINNLLEKYSSKLIILKGNHTNPIQYNKNHSYNQEYNNIEFIEDYTYKTINNNDFLFVGGAISIDRIDRVLNVSYWENEGVEYLSEQEFAGLKKCDILIMHSAPDFCFPVGYDSPIVKYWAEFDNFLIKDLTKERQYLGKLVNKVKPKQVYFGHFHQSNTEIINGVKYNLLNINEVKEVKL